MFGVSSAPCSFPLVEPCFGGSTPAPSSESLQVRFRMAGPRGV